MAAATGYSGTPLPRKLGLKNGQDVLFVGLPDECAFLASAADFVRSDRLDWPELAGAESGFDFIHAFTRNRADLDANAGRLRGLIVPSGMIWISWPKRASKVPTDIAEDVLREVFLPTGLVDVKVCAVDHVWSGLKFMVRKELR